MPTATARERSFMRASGTSELNTAEPVVCPVGASGVLRALRTDRFKAGQLSFATVLPITRENAVMAPLMLSVLRRGTERYPTLADVNRRLDDLYGSSLWVQCFYRGDRLILGFGMDLLDETYLPEPINLTECVLEILDQILFHPRLDADGLLSARHVEREKELQCDEIRSLRNVPAQYAAAHARRFFYRDTPAGIPLYGTEEEVRAVTREALTAYWLEWRKNLVPNCFYIGSADPEKTSRALERVFVRAENADAHPVKGLSDLPVKTDATAAEQLEEELTASQGQLVLGFRTGGVTVWHPDYAAVAVMTELLGLSPVSLLFKNVREKLSLCYSVSAGYDGFRGSLFVSCSLASRARERAEREILSQIDVIREGRFTDEEFDAAKKSIGGSYRQLEDRPASLEAFWFGRALAGVNDTPETCRRRFSAVTREEVVRAARRLSLDTVYFLRGTASEEVPDDVLEA